MQSAHELQRAAVSYTILSSVRLYVLIPHFACPCSIDSPGSEQPNAHTPFLARAEYRQMGKKIKLGFCSERISNPQRTSLMHSQSAPCRNGRARNKYMIFFKKKSDEQRRFGEPFILPFPASAQMPSQSAHTPRISVISTLSDLQHDSHLSS